MSFQIRRKTTFKPYDLTFTPSTQFEAEFEETVNGDEPLKYTFTLERLEPSTKYEVQVIAHSSKGEGDPATLQHYTRPATSEGIFVIDFKLLSNKDIFENTSNQW